MSKLIVKLENYADEAGHLVQERTIIKVVEPAPKLDRFIGSAGIPIETPMGPQIEKFEFPIPASTLEEAFGLFDKSARAFIKRVEDDARKDISMPKKPGLILPG